MGNLAERKAQYKAIKHIEDPQCRCKDCLDFCQNCHRATNSLDLRECSGCKKKFCVQDCLIEGQDKKVVCPQCY